MRATFLIVTIACMLFTGEAEAEEHKITLEGWEFHPPALTIHVGDSVTWVNNDDTTHNIAFEDESLKAPTREEPYKIKVGKDFSFAFTKAGEFSYFCKLHFDQDMTGKVIVEEIVK